MSAGYAYYSIRILNKQNEPDPELAQKIFDWCKDKYPWWSEYGGEDDGGPFFIDTSDASIYSDEWNIKRSDGIDSFSDLDWLQDVYEEFHPYQMIAFLHLDYGETSMDLHSLFKGRVRERKGERKFVTTMSCNFTDCLGEYGAYGIQDSSNFNYMSDSFEEMCLVFRNYETDELELSLNVQVVADSDEYEDDLSGACMDGEFKLTCDGYDLLDENEDTIKYPSDFDHLSEDALDDIRFNYDMPEDDYALAGIGYFDNETGKVVLKYKACGASLDDSDDGACGYSDANCVTDSEGNRYSIVTIGDQVWMAENLKLECEGSSVMNNDEDKDIFYGRLYTWEAAKANAPEGWHLPTVEEFEQLKKFVEDDGNKFKAGAALKADESDWPKAKGTNAYGFNAVPGGHNNGMGMFMDEGRAAYFWTATESGSMMAYDFELTSFGNDITKMMRSKKYGLSVRYVKD